MNHFVLDSSVALAWCFEDETSLAAERALDLLETDRALVPPIWPAEVGNGLLVAERRKRISKPGVSRSLALLRSLNIRVDEEDPKRLVEEWIDLARQYKLSVYDAAYLALALKRGMRLATLDRVLIRAAAAAGAQLLGV